MILATMSVWMKACNLIKGMLATNETARPTAKDPATHVRFEKAGV